MMGTSVTISMKSDGVLVGEVTELQKTEVIRHEEKERQKIRKKLGHPSGTPLVLGATQCLPSKPKITTAAGVNRELTLRPISAMLELARGTALSEDPDITALARRWSALRYLGVFGKDPQDKLLLDKQVLKFIGANQRRVISEELGIGFGIIVGKIWCKERKGAVGKITAIDVDIALEKGEISKQDRVGKRQPDYLLAYSVPNSRSVTIFDLLETKGTTTKGNAKTQLGRAVTQLAGLTIGSQAMTGIAVSTVSTETGVHVMAVDPEYLPMTWTPTTKILQSWRANKVDSQRDNSEPEVDDRELNVGGRPLNMIADEFFAAAISVDNASLAAFSGQFDVAKEWLPNFATHRDTNTNSEVRRVTDAGTFVGIEYVIEIPGISNRLQLFQGVHENVLEGLKQLNVEAVLEAQQEFAAARYDATKLYAKVKDGITDTVSDLSSDGAMMEIRLH